MARKGLEIDFSTWNVCQDYSVQASTGRSRCREGRGLSNTGVRWNAARMERMHDRQAQDAQDTMDGQDRTLRRRPRETSPTYKPASGLEVKRLRCSRHPPVTSPVSPADVLAFRALLDYDQRMTKSSQSPLDVLRAHEAELRALGVEGLTLFGSLARGDGTEGSDADLAVRPGRGFSSGGFDHFGQMAALRDRLIALLGRDVDLVEETAIRARLWQVIEREGVRAF